MDKNEKEKMRMVSYGYARVSSTEQNLERQLKAIKQYKPSISDNNIFCDKMTGNCKVVDISFQAYTNHSILL